MPTSPINEVIHYLRSTLLPEGADPTDGQLLERFVSRRDAAALEALVRRHGPMVWGVCHRVLQNHHDAEDAFQATFLVLVRKAASIRSGAKVGNWLYGVAHQTALKARATRAKRRLRETQVTDMPEPAVAERDTWSDLQAVLDEELSRLPEKYRTVIVLCDLEGKTSKEAARHLGLSQGTVASRLARARVMLAKRLSRHGLGVTGGTLAAVLSEKAASACVPPSVSSTIKAATLVAAGQAATSGVVSVKVAALTEGVMKTMLLTKLKSMMAVTLAAVVTVGIGAGLLTLGTAAGRQKEGNKADVLAAEQAEHKKENGKTDKEGQPQKDTAKADKEKLQGVWQMESMEGDGQKVSSDDLKNAPPEETKVWIAGDKWITKNGQGKEEKVTYKLDTSKRPKAINIESVDGRLDQLGIYELNGDELKVCLCGGEKQERPAKFSTEKGSPNMLIIYKRVPKKD